MSNDTLLPTPERIRHAGEHYVVPKIDHDRNAKAGIVMTPIERLYNRGQITIEQRLAGDKFVKHYTLGTSPGRVTGSYGERTSSGVEAEGPPELCRTHNFGIYAKAAAIINHPPSLKALIAFAIEDCDLKTIGRIGRLNAPKCDKQASAAGLTIIENVLDRLSHYFGMHLKPPRR